MGFRIIDTLGKTEPGLPIWRYLNWSAFKRLMEHRVLRLRNCTAYEDFDFHEGKISNSYRKVLLKALKLDHHPDDEVTVEEQFASLIKRIEMNRQHTYISCWTTNGSEDERMWHSYANPGVIIGTTLGHVLDQVGEFADAAGTYDEAEQFDHYSMIHGPIDYNREKMHLKLDRDVHADHHLPIFHLSSDDIESFKHESEYRIALIDEAGVQQLEDKYEDTYLSDSFVIENLIREIEIPFNPNVIQEVVVCKALETSAPAYISQFPRFRAMIRLSSLSS